jgi:hypothetical protein
MATRIEAIAKYRPRVDLARTVTMLELAEYIAGRTGLNRGEILNMLAELNEAVYLLRSARYVYQNQRSWDLLALDHTLRSVEGECAAGCERWKSAQRGQRIHRSDHQPREHRQERR